MTDSESERLGELRELAERVARTAHEDLSAGTTEALWDFAQEVESNLEGEQWNDAARRLLAFWKSFVRTKLDIAADEVDAIESDTIRRFEQAFDEDIIGIDLYQALETLAIVEDMPEAETDEDRLAQWSARVHSLTDDFVAHLESHQE